MPQYTQEERQRTLNEKRERYARPFRALNDLSTYIAETNAELSRVEVENGKLRDLLAEMYHTLDDTCKYHDRMSELNVEV